MRARSLIRRFIALQLLLALPTVVGARLSLDIRVEPDGSDGVEVQHTNGCSILHDHGVCALLLRSPWSPGPASPSITALLPPITLVVPKAATRAPDTGGQPASARAPPHAA